MNILSLNRNCIFEQDQNCEFLFFEIETVNFLNEKKKKSYLKFCWIFLLGLSISLNYRAGSAIIATW